VGQNNPYSVQHLLGRARWDAEAVCAEVKNYVREHLGSNEVILAVDETSFIKQGQHSVGVQVQYCGTTGHKENCQVGVFLTYISQYGHTLIDCRLYLPQSWAEDKLRRKKASVPEAVEFATKPKLARQMLQQAFESGIRPTWVVADEVYGNDGKFWRWLEQEHDGAYLLHVSVNHSVWVEYQQYRAGVIASSLTPQQWQRFSCGQGSKGERLYDWARIEVNCDNEQGFKRWLLFRRNIERPDDPRSITYYQVYAKSETTLQQMVEIAGKRWAIEECFKLAKNHFGLGDYEVRSWSGWHRHMSLVLAASAFVTVLRHHVEPIMNTQKNQTTNSSVPPHPMASFKAARGLLSA
jgi:SRSO17 transposase